MEIPDKLNNRIQVLAFAKLVRQGRKLFQQDYKIFWNEYGAPGLSPASPIVNPGLSEKLVFLLGWHVAFNFGRNNNLCQFTQTFE